MLTKSDKMYIDQRFDEKFTEQKEVLLEALDEYFSKQNDQMAKGFSDVLGRLKNVEDNATVTDHHVRENTDRIEVLEAKVSFA